MVGAERTPPETGPETGLETGPEAGPEVSPAPGPRTCDFCGAHEADAARAALTWTTATERGRTRSFCPRCSREHLRAMESKLDSEWW
ncbi:hypothetical protein [Nocardioides perillae]|uniref:Uncharacterized protein n=1 Tax=Nocardioides perillae TaxID=1119534 RepID=A0A7Y9RTY1_9ACTN|nr:hypothetical protein [Nocardioides perillae]NYG55261.1 hypothetical protein [Nocardioides perillae]